MVDIKDSFHMINMKRRNFFEELLEKNDLNFMEVEIVVFLNDVPESNTFTDIMKSKDYAKSHISVAISRLVEKEYIKKESLPNNKKTYKLFLLEKSKPIVDEYNICVEEFRKCAFSGVTDEEYKIFERVIWRMSQNLMDS